MVEGKGGQVCGDGRLFDWVVVTQCNIQIMHHGNVHLKPI